MTTLPPEIWLHIAKFMSSDDLRDMLGFNSTFFQLAMDVRYNDVLFTSFDERRQLGYLRRLRDPGVAQRVRSLRVVVEFGDGFQDEYRARNNPNLEQNLAAPQETWNLQTALDTIDNSVNEVLQAMTETVACLTNITYFFIYWTQISPSVEHLCPFLTTTWREIGPRVQELDLVASLNYMPWLISTTMTGTFKELRKLEVKCHPREESEDQNEILSTTSTATILPQFINNVAPTLTRLSLSALTSNLDVSSLLNQVGHIPHLQRLSIRFVGWNSDLLPNHTYLSRFLQNHAESLRCFRWSGGSGVQGFRPQDGRSDEELMVEFLSGNRLDEAFSNLRKLEFPAPESDVGYRLLLRHIKRSASTLVCLRIWGCFLTYDQADMLVSLFDPRPRGHPKELVLWTEVLSPELVFLLARTCPRLETLHITTSYVAAVNENGQGAPERSAEALSNARKFANRMREYDFSDWSLTDIHIQQKPSRTPRLYDRVMLLFRECVPLVKKFEEPDSRPWRIRNLSDEELRL